MQANRVILHVDVNCFYASCEIAEDPSLRGKPLAVCGDPVMRHAIVLAKSYEAKKYGILTGLVTWKALQLCPNLIIKIVDFDKYMPYITGIYNTLCEYSPLVESYGCDEAWLEITKRGITLEAGRKLANHLQLLIMERYGLPVSIGVSYTKTFAKLGSDYKKPSGITVITPDNYRDIVWPLPVGDLLNIGEKTVEKLAKNYIFTIGELANTPADFLKRLLGINGLKHLLAAQGEETYPVRPVGVNDAVKSVGHSITFPHDLSTVDEVAAGSYVIAESVAARLRAQDKVAGVVHFGLRDAKLNCASCQRTLRHSTSLSGEIAEMAQTLFQERYSNMLPLRSLGIYCTSLSSASAPMQLDLFADQTRHEKAMALEHAKDKIRLRYGPSSILRGTVMLDPKLASLSPKDDHKIHPMPFYTGK